MTGQVCDPARKAAQEIAQHEIIDPELVVEDRIPPLARAAPREPVGTLASFELVVAEPP